MIFLMVLALAGCALGAVGVFLPWLIENGAIFSTGLASSTIGGITALQPIDGIICLVVCAVAAGWIVYTLVAQQTRYWYVTAVAGFALSLIGYTSFSDIRTIVSVLSDMEGVTWSVGLGPYFTAGGGVITLLCGLGAGWIHRARSQAFRPPTR